MSTYTRKWKNSVFRCPYFIMECFAKLAAASSHIPTISTSVRNWEIRVVSTIFLYMLQSLSGLCCLLNFSSNHRAETHKSPEFRITQEGDISLTYKLSHYSGKKKHRHETKRHFCTCKYYWPTAKCRFNQILQLLEIFVMAEHFSYIYFSNNDIGRLNSQHSLLGFKVLKFHH